MSNLNENWNILTFLLNYQLVFELFHAYGHTDGMVLVGAPQGCECA
jgi:hypothetical protein